MINRLFRLINRQIHLLHFLLCTILERLYITSIGVQIGKGSKFRGWCSIFRANDSTIILGNHCIFNSSGYTNHIGLNHRCILTTMNAYAEILIGDNFGMSSSTITAFQSIHIGDNVRVGANSVIMDGDFHLDDPRSGEPKSIFIGNNVWIGANVVILKGVNIGNGSVIGMNSVVTKDIPDYVIAVGNPCKVIKSLRVQ